MNSFQNLEDIKLYLECPTNYKNDTETNRCVLSCQTCKDPNAEFNQCASSCQPSCEKPVTGICNRMCNVGCFCKKEYIQDPQGKCILPEQCVKPSKNLKTFIE